MNSKAELAALLMKFHKIPERFTIELYDGTKYPASLATFDTYWTGFDDLENTKLSTPQGLVNINMYQVKDIY